MSETPPSKDSVSSTEASRATATITTPTHLNRSFNYRSGSISVESDYFDVADLSISPPTDLKQDAGYYHGIPSNPKLLARSRGDDWVQPRSKFDIGFPEPKVLASINPSHPIKAIWELPLGNELLQMLDRTLPTANSVDILKVCYAFEVDSANPVVWIGVTPDTITSTRAKAAVRACKALLDKHGMLDVEVEIKESIVYPLANNRLYDPMDLPVATQDVTRRFSASSGLAITTRAKPFTFGSSAFFVRDQLDKNNTIMLLTGQHVVSGSTNVNGYNTHLSLPLDKKGNLRPRLKGTDAQSQIDEARPTEVVVINADIIKQAQSELRKMVRRKLSQVEKEKIAVDAALTPDRLERAQINLQGAKLDYKQMKETESHLSDSWFQPNNNALGRVLCFPERRFNFGQIGYTQDFGVIELDKKLLPQTIHNVLDLSSDAAYDYADYASEAPSLAIPDPGFLRIQGMLNETDMNGNLSVIYRGAKSGLKRGLSMSVRSMVKTYGEDGIKSTDHTKCWSREWPITAITEDHSIPFCQPGDSGSGVITRDGRAGGILTGGSGNGLGPEERGCIDVTYVTPIYWILERMKEQGFRDPQLL
ncbi:hypothetical protein V866_002187 [Kwoniella sp. B9012]